MSEAKYHKAEPPADRRRGVLEIASFLCGAAVMVLEMAGSRIVAPYMGTSLVVWTSLIGVIMASLSAGYWLGGVTADKWPETKILARIILGAAVLTTATAFAANPVLTALFRASVNAGAGLYLSSAAGALLLFAAPSALLGMVSPFIVKLAMRDLGTSGATVGRFSALSSLGSILGTFLGGFVLISFFAAGTILLLVAGVLALVAILLYRAARSAEWKKAALFCAAFFALFGRASARGMPMMPPGDHIDTAYNHIWIAEEIRPNGQRARYLMTGALNEGAQSVIYTKNPAELVSAYTKFYDLAFHYKPGVKKILMLGGGGYCVPRHLSATRPEVSVDVVEIDPGVTDAARKYFYLQDKGNPNIAIYHEDARIFLNRVADARTADAREAGSEKGLYDAVFADVFGSWYSIPFHLATVEAARKMYDLLAEDGVLVSNVISALKGPRSGVFDGIYAAVAQVFPKVLIFPATSVEARSAAYRQNIMIVAFKSEKTFEAASPSSSDPEIARLLSHRWTPPFNPVVPAFTDAFAPVEYYALAE